MHHGSSLLLDLDGLVVESVQRTVEGSRIVQIATAPQWVGVCPQCGQKSTRSKGWVTTRPRDVQVGPDRPLLVWRKRKWLCTNISCDRKVFTESTPGVPSRARVTPRAKALLVEAVLDGDRSVAAVAGDYGCAWHTVHGHLVVVADAALAGEPEPVMVLGIDETRRGKAKWETDPDTGVRSWVDRWDTGLVDLTGDQGLLAQVNGRTSAVVIDWFDARDEAWKAQITHVAIDMSSVYSKAVREALPHAQLVVDRFHLVKKANEMVDTVRRRVTQAERGRRGRKSDVEWINRRRLLRASERLTNEQRSALFEKLTAADPHGDIAAAWIAKELLRDVLRCTDRGGLRHEIRDRLYRFYTFCAACRVPEIGTLAATVSAWQEPMILAITTGLSNARSEGFGPHRQARRPHRVRIPQSRQSTPPGTVGLHSTVTSGRTQPAPMPLLTAKSRICPRSRCGYLHRCRDHIAAGTPPTARPDR